MDIKVINSAIKTIVSEGYNIPRNNITISSLPSSYLAKNKWNYGGTLRFETFKYSIYWIKAKDISQAYIVEENI